MITYCKYILFTLVFIAYTLNASDTSDPINSKKFSARSDMAVQFLTGATAATVVLVSASFLSGDNEAIKTAITSPAGIGGQLVVGTLLTRYLAEKLSIRAKNPSDLLKPWMSNFAGYGATTAAFYAYFLRSR